MAGTISQFIKHHFRHFNAAELVRAAQGYCEFLDNNGKFIVTLAGAMSTARIGLTLAEMIRQDKVHAISCTGANLEEDIFNLIGRNEYKYIPDYRSMNALDEADFLSQKYNRVTDVCIPEHVFEIVGKRMLEEWIKYDGNGTSLFPYEYFYNILNDNSLRNLYQVDPKESWVIAASAKGIPIFVGGWEDSTLGNLYASHCIRGNIKNIFTVRSGIETMIKLTEWYLEMSRESEIGFFQIGGGIAGDFPICVVPLLKQDLGLPNIRSWGYFCQISDSTTSYGSYSGAVPNEKITWGKIEANTPKYIIESDATIVAPLIFAYVLGW